MPNITEPHIIGKPESSPFEGSVLTPNQAYNQFSAISPIQSNFSNSQGISFTSSVNEGFLVPCGAADAPPPPPDLSGGTGGSPLPCLREHNCDRIDKNYEQKVTARLSRSRKSQATLKENLLLMIKLFGIEKIGFLTLTFGKGLRYNSKKDILIANRRWHNLCRRVLPEIIGEGTPWVIAIEPTGRGRIHFHAVIVLKKDIRQGFDFETAKKTPQEVLNSMPEVARRKFWREITTNQDLKGYWKLLREKCPKYGFGIHQLLPVMYPDRMADYIGKYLTKEEVMLASPLGCRRLRYSENWSQVVYHEKKQDEKGREYTQIYRRLKPGDWVKSSGKPFNWRLGCTRFAVIHGTTWAEIKEDFGVHWAWTYRQDILFLGELSHGDFEMVLAYYEKWPDLPIDFIKKKYDRGWK